MLVKWNKKLWYMLCSNSGVCEQGEPGVSGGFIEAVGEQGLQGEQGITGAQGIQGIQGQQGIQGLQGATGAQGLKSDQGDQGATCARYSGHSWQHGQPAHKEGPATRTMV